MFALMDTDNDGKITYEELKAGLRKVGSQLAEPEIKLLMDVVSFQISTIMILINHLYLSILISFLLIWKKQKTKKQWLCISLKSIHQNTSMTIAIYNGVKYSFRFFDLDQMRFNLDLICILVKTMVSIDLYV